MEQNYGYDQTAAIVTEVPTKQRFTQRLIVSVAAALNNLSVHTRDITQAYSQSRTKLEKDVHIKAPEEMDLPFSSVMKVVKSLCDIP